MEKKNKVVEFVNANKKKIALGVIGAVTAIGSIVLVAMGKKRSKDIQVTDWGCGTLEECWRENGWINTIATDATVGDAGKLGEELMKIDGVTANTALQAMLFVEDVKVN